MRRIDEEGYHGLFEAVPDALVIVDAAGRIVAINAASELLLGYDRSELEGQPVECLIPPALRTRHEAFRSQYMRAPGPRSMGKNLGLRIVRKDGVEVPVDIMLSALETRAGTLVVCAIRDNTESALVGAALQASETRFRMLVEQATDGIFLTDLEGHYVDVNAAACAMFGYTRDELLALSIIDLIMPSEIERLTPEIDRLADGSVVLTEWRFRRKDGSTFTGEVNTRQVGGTHLLAILRDVTERDRVEQDLRKANRFMEAVAVASPSWIYVFDLDDLSLRYTNRSILRQLGHPPATATITRLEEFQPFLPEEEMPHLLGLLTTWRTLAVDTVHEDEYQIRHADGTLHWFLGRETVFTRHADGRVHQILGTLDDVTDRRHADEALRQSELRWKFALDGARDGVWDWDPRTDLAFFGPRWKEMLGYAESEIGGTRSEWTSRVHPDDLPAAIAAIEAHLAGETPYFTTEHRMRCRDGSWLWVLDRGRVVERGVDSHPLRVVGTLTDISPLKEAFERLQESESRFRTLIEDLDVGVLLQDARDDRILLSNNAASAMLGLGTTELDHLSSHTWPWQLLREDGTEYARDALPSVVAAHTGQPVRNQVVGSFNTRTGACRWLQVTAMPRRSADGSVEHVLVTMTDVTARKVSDDALIAAREEWEHSFNALTDWVSILDREGRVVHANRAMRERFETDPDSLRGVHHSTIYAGENGSDVDPCASVLDGGPPVEFATTLSRVPGHFVVSCYPLKGAGGAVHVVRDITRQRLLEEQLRQSQKMHAIGQLAGGVAHDFNNLLTVILSCSELALMDLTGDLTGVRESINSIRGAADRAARLTRQLLVFGRKARWEEQLVDLNQVVQRAGQMLQRVIGEDITLTTSLAPRLATIRADATQLEQVVVNLALNARDAMPHGGHLTIETRNVTISEAECRSDPALRPGRFVQLTVRDSGCGIPEEVRAHLFEPFFTTKGPDKGTGLGLSIVYGVVEHAAGFIVVNTALGVGTSFRVCFPAVEEAPREHRAPDEAERGATGTETVLVVEDESAVRQVLVRALMSHGFKVLDVSSADEAVALLEREGANISILVTDVIMPGAGGRELSKRARVIRPGLPVLFVSGYSAEIFSRQGLPEQGHDLLQKPFTPATLATKVREVIDAAN